MKHAREPLTPAEQMRRIREAVEASESETAWNARAELAAIILQLEALQEHLASLEQSGSLQPGPFTPGPPGGGFLSGRMQTMRNWLSRRQSVRLLAGRLRAAWNWVALNTFVPAIAAHQNQINATTLQLLHGVLDALDSMSRLVQQLYREVGGLEDQGRAGLLRGQDPPSSCISR